MTNEPLFVSLIALIASPESYQGKQVRVIGYVVSKMEVQGIFVSQSDCLHSITKNGIWLDSDRSDLPSVDEGYVLVEGIFDATSRGHLGMWSATIRDVTLLQPWGESENS